ncbi:hypothetical protein ABPG74_015643 [Tetrahymena malaccensis]
MNGYANGNGNWNNQRNNQNNKMASNQQNYNKNINMNNMENKQGKSNNINYNQSNNTNSYNQKNQGYQNQGRYNGNNGSNGGSYYQNNNYNNNRNNYNQQQYYNNYNNMQYQMWAQSNQLGNIGYNNMMGYPNMGADINMQMWDMNQLQQANILDVNSQNFPSLTNQFPPPVYISENGVQTQSDAIDSSIPDSSELERQLIEQSMKMQNSNKTNPKDDQTNQITDVNVLFSQMNMLQNGQENGQDQDSQIMVRTKQGVYLIDYNMKGPLEDSQKISKWNSYSFFIQDGHYIICADPQNIGVFSTTKKKLLDHKTYNDIQDLLLSPLQKYLVCIEKPDDNTDDIKLQILDALSLQKVDIIFFIIYNQFQICLVNKTSLFFSFIKQHKEFDYNFFSKSRMNLYMFDKNEDQIFIREKKEIKIYSTSNFELTTIVNAESFIYQYLSPSQDRQQLLLLTPEFSKGYEMIPAQLKLFEISDLTNPILDQSISKSQEVVPVWSPNGQHLLLWCSTIKDDTGNTYYGQHTIYRYKPESRSIEPLNFYKGVIHDIQWQPNSEHFVVIGGGMPSHSVLFTKEGVPIFEFGRHHINKVKWNPYSKLLFLGGFGNLGGDIEVWSVKDLKKIGQFKAHCTVSSAWSYDGTKILCGVLFPKLRVQNNFKVFNVYGEQCKFSDFSNTDLYEVCWHPYPFPEERDLTDKKSSQNNQLESENSGTENKNGEQEKPKKGILTKRGNLSSMLNEAKISNHGGKKLQPNETFEREEDKEMEQVKQSTTQKKLDQGIMFSRNKNKLEQQKQLTEEEEKAIEKEKKAQKKQKKPLQLKDSINNNQEANQQRIQEDLNFENGSGKGSSGGRTSPEIDDFFNETDEVNDYDRQQMQAIIKKNEF